MDNKKYMRIIKKHGKDILASDGMKIEKTCIQHGIFSVYDHSLFVTRMCLHLADIFSIRVDTCALVRGALLHDYFLYDWHIPSKVKNTHGFTHPNTAFRNASRDFKLGIIESNMIRRHMFPLTPIPPKYRESVLLCIADKICAGYETIDGFKRRFKKRFRRLDTNA